MILLLFSIFVFLNLSFINLFNSDENVKYLLYDDDGVYMYLCFEKFLSYCTDKIMILLNHEYRSVS